MFRQCLLICFVYITIHSLAKRFDYHKLKTLGPIPNYTKLHKPRQIEKLSLKSDMIWWFSLIKCFCLYWFDLTMSKNEILQINKKYPNKVFLESRRCRKIKTSLVHGMLNWYMILYCTWNPALSLLWPPKQNHIQINVCNVLKFGVQLWVQSCPNIWWYQGQ